MFKIGKCTYQFFRTFCSFFWPFALTYFGKCTYQNTRLSRHFRLEFSYVKLAIFLVFFAKIWRFTPSEAAIFPFEGVSPSAEPPLQENCSLRGRKKPLFFEKNQKSLGFHIRNSNRKWRLNVVFW